jgi:hypothetical protein
MDELFPGRKRFTGRNEKGELTFQRIAHGLDWTARVVCKRCNETWMSDIESKHAKPAMTDLIMGKTGVTISRARAQSLAVFGFKTAVIFDHLKRERQPFFVRAARYRFRECLAIPPNIGMWMAGFLPRAHGEVLTAYGEGQLTPTNRVRMYVCTYAVGHLVLQVVGARQQGFLALLPSPEFDRIAFPFWPVLGSEVIWPFSSVIKTAADLSSFSQRWQTIRTAL